MSVIIRNAQDFAAAQAAGSYLQLNKQNEVVAYGKVASFFLKIADLFRSQNSIAARQDSLKAALDNILGNKFGNLVKDPGSQAKLSKEELKSSIANIAGHNAAPKAVQIDEGRLESELRAKFSGLGKEDFAKLKADVKGYALQMLETQAQVDGQLRGSGRIEDYQLLVEGYLIEIDSGSRPSPFANFKEVLEGSCSGKTDTQEKLPSERGARQDVIRGEVLNAAIESGRALDEAALERMVGEFDAKCSKTTSTAALREMIAQRLGLHQQPKAAEVQPRQTRADNIPASELYPAAKSRGALIQRGQIFTQKRGSNTCFMLSVFNALCSTEFGVGWLNSHAARDLTGRQTLRFQPTVGPMKGQDFEVGLSSQEALNVKNAKSSMSCFEAALAAGYMKCSAGASPDDMGADIEYRPGDYGEAELMGNFMGLYGGAKYFSQQIDNDKERFLAVARDFINSNKGIILRHESGNHFTAVTGFTDDGKCRIVDSLYSSSGSHEYISELCSGSFRGSAAGLKYEFIFFKESDVDTLGL